MTLERPYCSLEEVQRETHNSGSELDAWYTQCVNLASRWAEEFCNRDWWYHDHASSPLTVNRGWVLSDEIFLPFPILTLTAIEVDGSPWDLEDVTYENSAKGSSVISSGGVDFAEYPFKGTLKLTGTFGYALASSKPTTSPPPKVPAGVRRAVTLIAAAVSSEKHIEQVGLDGTRTEILDTRIPPEARKLLTDFIKTENFC